MSGVTILNGITPSINHLLSICGREEYRNTMLCKLISAYAHNNRSAAVNLARDMLELIRKLSGTKGGGGPRILVSAGPSRHWRDSFQYAYSHGLVPWACGFSLENSILGPPRRGGPHYNVLLDALARGFFRRGNVVEALPPIIVYHLNGFGVIGFGLVVWADVSPLRIKLWSGESCPPSAEGRCYTIRWYTLPIALGCKVISEQEEVIEPSSGCVINKVSVGAARNCAQSASRNEYSRLVEALLSAVEDEAGAEKVGFAVELVSSASKTGAEFPRPSLAGAHPEEESSGSMLAVESWRDVLGNPGIVESIVKEIYSRGVFIPEQLVKIIAFLVANGNVLLAGPPGFGKTLLARIIAEVTKSDTVSATCHAGWTRSEFIGGPYLRQGSITWRSGYLVRAVARALQGHRVLLLLDEVNRAEVDKVFGEFFTLFSSPSAEEWNIDDLCDIVCGENSEEELDEPARILCSACKKPERLQKVRELLRIVATMNTVDYATVFAVGEAFGRRFYKVEFITPSDTNYILENEVKPVFQYVAERFNLSDDKLKSLEGLLEKLAGFVAELRKAKSEAGIAGVVVTQLPIGPAFVREVVTIAARMLATGVIDDPVCAITQAIEASIPMTVLVEEESRERLRRALVSAFGDTVEDKCRLVADRS